MRLADLLADVFGTCRRLWTKITPASSRPESKTPQFKEFPAPTQCVLWREPALAVSERGRFDVLESYVDDTHLSRSLLKCRECGQLYFYEFYEHVDWDGGDDAQYWTFIPVPTRQDAAAMKDLDVFEVLFYSPRLQRDHRTGTPGHTLTWVGKDA